jgi:FkbM family methyltransferase
MLKMHIVIKKFTLPVAWRLLRKLKFGKYHSLDRIDRKVEKYLPHRKGFFVELGANDGVTYSNTLFFEKNKDWRGVLVEPIPHNYLSCLDNRSVNNFIFCGACVSFEYKERFVEIAYSNMMSSPMGLESDIIDPKAHAETGQKFIGGLNKPFTFGAVAITLNELLLKSKAPKNIDFLSLDVEGAEIEVLKGVDHSKFKFKYMCVECRDIAKLTNYLNPLGYEMIERLSEGDYLFKAQID